MAPTLNSSVQTPSGVIFPNRMAKSAMAELLAKNSDPDDRLVTLYTAWGSGNWGVILTGDIDVSTKYKGSAENIAVKSSISASTRQDWERLAHAGQREDTPMIAQINHPGRQSLSGSRGFFEKTIAPSAVALKIGDGLLERLLSRVLFGTPREMTQGEIDEVVQEFVRGAKFAYETGFKGVELHAGHGFLLTQFLSPKTNLRTDMYGGTPAKRTKIVIDIIRAVRKEVPASFCVGIKLNSADVGGSESLEDSLEQVGLIAQEQIDFLEISGGTMENMRMASGDDPKSIRTAAREAFFLDYAKAVRERYPNLILMVTGGFRSREGMVAALESNSCDLIGVGRPACVDPHWPKNVILNKDVKDPDARMETPLVKGNWLVRMIPIKLVGIGIDTMFYSGQIARLATGQKTIPPTQA